MKIYVMLDEENKKELRLVFTSTERQNTNFNRLLYEINAIENINNEGIISSTIEELNLLVDDIMIKMVTKTMEEVAQISEKGG
jgi:hypothetical protein